MNPLFLICSLLSIFVIRAISRDFMEVRMSECILVLDDKYYQLQHIRSLPAAFGKTDD